MAVGMPAPFRSIVRGRGSSLRHSSRSSAPQGFCSSSRASTSRICSLPPPSPVLVEWGFPPPSAPVALAVVLLSGAGLLIRSVAKLLHVNAGLDPTSSITIDLQLPDAAYQQWPRVDQFYTTLTQSLRANPEVTGVGAANFLPLEPGWRIGYTVVGTSVAAAEAPQAQYHIADDGYFSTLRVPIVAGRVFTAQDNAQSIPVVVVNEAMAK